MKKTVFISSTYEDLIEYRKAIWELLDKYDVNIKGMEAFGARKEAPLETCLNEVAQSDIFVGIVAQRLGSINKESGKSFTQLEYEKAVTENKEILIYLINEKNAKLLLEYIDFGEKREKLINFKTILKDRHTVDTFIDENDLKEKLERRLDEVLKIQLTTPEVLEDYKLSKDIMNKFLLLPKTYSDKEVKIKLSFNGNAFPASRELCERFGYKFGQTIGVPIKILEPVLTNNKFTEIFIEDDLADIYFNTSQNEIYEVLVKILFSNRRVKSLSADFFDKDVTIYKPNPNYDGRYTDVYYVPADIFTLNKTKFLTETKHIEGEGTAIIILREILKKGKNTKSKIIKKENSLKTNIIKK